MVGLFNKSLHFFNSVSDTDRHVNKISIITIPFWIESKPMHFSKMQREAEQIKATQMGDEMDPNKLFEDAMGGRWGQIVKTYGDCLEARKAKITKAGDTVLHIAVSDGKTDIVLQMVDAITVNDPSSSVLYTRNDRGNTALHLAAELGDVQMCESMASKDKGLIAARNNENETPLFSAALHGKKTAFLCLQSFLKKEDNDYYSLCRKKCGDTILHAAIAGEYFDLAFQIIYCYPELVNSVNENGQSPLHILASKPNVFKSSDHIVLFDSVIYKCIIVDPLKQEKYNRQVPMHMLNKDETVNYPENYQTCMDLFQILRDSFHVLTMGKGKNIKTDDQENPEPKSSSSPARPGSDGRSGDSSEMKKSRSSRSRNQPRKEDKDDKLYPPNYEIVVLYFKLMMKTLLIVLGLGISRIQKINEKKQRHRWANQVMHELVDHASLFKYDDNGRNPQNYQLENDIKAVGVMSAQTSSGDQENSSGNLSKEDGKKDTPVLVAAKIGVTKMVDKLLQTYPRAVQELVSAEKNLVLLTFEKKAETETKGETPILIAAKMGVAEVVEKILDIFPVAIQDLDSNNKNVVLLAVENRQPHVYNLLLKRKIMKESAFRQVDNQGNSALHLAAMVGGYRPWLIPGAALQMQWELKWYKFVKDSMPRNFFVRYNKKGQTPKEIFKETHKELVKSGSEWLSKTSESYSVVAALIATVAFSTSANIPGGVKEDSGAPKLGNEPAFNVFAISSVVALCFSVTSLVFFLAILTSRFQEKDFARDLPRKLLLGLTSLLTSIASILISFCAGHFFVLGDKVKSAAYPIYAATCFPVTFFVLAQLPLYFDLIRAILRKVPQRSYKEFPH